MNKQVSYKIVSLIFAVLILCFVIGFYVIAWTPPDQSPPEGNVSAPLNVGPDGQEKAGGLLLNTGGAPNGLIVQKGNVGIGTTDPRAKLEVVTPPNDSPSEGAGIKLTSSDGSHSIQLRIDDYVNLESIGTPLWINNGPCETLSDCQDVIIVPNGGNVGIGVKSPTEKLDVGGNIKATAFLYSSDQRLKQNIKPIIGALNKIIQLQGVEFEWRETGEKSIGLIAQDVEKVFPELVKTDSDTGLKSLQYGNLVAPLIEAIKEQQEQIEKLKQEIKELKLKFGIK